MNNSVAISLLFTSLLAAQVRSPNPQANQKPDVITREGHRVIVVETYDQNGHPSTKVSISPPQDPISADDRKFPSGLVDNAKDKIKQGVSSVFVDTTKFVDGGEGHSTAKLITDALDKRRCVNAMSEAMDEVKDADMKQKVETVYEKAKEKASETARGAKEVAENVFGTATGKASEKVHGAKEVVGNTYEKATDMAHGAQEAVGNTYEKASEKVSEVARGAKEVVGNAYKRATNTKAPGKPRGAKEVVGDAFGKAWKTASEKAQGAREATHGAKEAVDSAYERTKSFAGHSAPQVKDTTLKQVRDTAKTTRDMGKTIGTDMATNVSQQVGNLKYLSGMAASGIFQGIKDGIEYLSSGKWVNPLFGVVNCLGLAMGHGMGTWVTFLSSHVLASSLPRHQFGLVQSRIYPVYFRAMGVSIVVALLGHIGGHRGAVFSNKGGRLQVYNLLASLLANLINAFYLEPSATKVMLEKFRLEKEEGRGRETQGQERSRAEDGAVPGIVETAMAEEAEQQEQREVRERMRGMDQRLKSLNSFSGFLNILTLMGLSWHLVHLGQRLHLTS